MVSIPPAALKRREKDGREDGRMSEWMDGWMHALTVVHTLADMAFDGNDNPRASDRDYNDQE